MKKIRDLRLGDILYSPSGNVDSDEDHIKTTTVTALAANANIHVNGMLPAGWDSFFIQDNNRAVVWYTTLEAAEEAAYETIINSIKTKENWIERQQENIEKLRAKLKKIQK